MKELEKFTEWMNLNYEVETTRGMYLRHVNEFFKENDVFTQETVDNYLRNKKVGSGTFNIISASLKTYNRFLTNYLKQKIDISYPRPRTSSSRDPKFITEEQLDEIIEKLPIVFYDYEKARAVLLLMFYTGMRPIEIISLTRDNIDLDQCCIDVIDTKTHRDRKVAFNTDIKEYIRAYFNRDNEEENAFNIDKLYLEYICRRIKRYFSLKDFSPYVLRHSHAKWYLKISNCNYDSLQKLMGHTNILTTHNYTRKSNDEAIDDYNNVVNKRKRKKKW
ncbi:MAG: site-specific integrase [Novosphingobium sp.]|nr:site-specific integrase [Novosphingobium sp.]